MATVAIYDLEDQRRVLAVELGRLLGLLAPRSLQTHWTLHALEFAPKIFEATGAGGEQLEQLAATGAKIAGTALAALAKETIQVINGQFTATSPGTEEGSWVTIRFVDSTFCEVSTLDETVIEKIRTAYKDVRSY